jgi:CBS-domain-containing membrane protein
MATQGPASTDDRTEPPLGESVGDPIADILPELTDEDVAEAMRDIPGYLDISPRDFRELYRASATHALARLAGNPMARSLMRVGGPALEPHQYLPEAVGEMARNGVKSAAVVDRTSKVIGILTETDVLRQLEVASALALLVRLSGEPDSLGRCCARVRVDAVMTSPAETLRADANLREMAAAFHRHGGRTMPVVDVSGRLLGMLARKDLIHTCGVAGSSP